MRRIRGSGGGKGGGGGGGGGATTARTPIEGPDSLRSKQYARVLDLISEGEIGGLIAGAQSVFFDNTPLLNANGTLNFAGVTVSSVNGTQSQSYIPGFPAVENEIQVGTEVTAATPITRTITNENTDSIRVTLAVLQLTSQNPTTGDITGTAVEFQIYIQSNGGGFGLWAQDAFSGKTTSRYQRNILLNLPPGGAPWDIMVLRTTPDSLTVSVQDNLFWDSYTEIIDAKLSYPNSALVGIEIDASQFTSIPTRGYEILGIRVLVPTNYNSTTRAYDGVWDGNFQIAWTDNPAWCFYDLLTNTRYGLGAFISPAQVDKWSLYSIAQYCDALVPNGFGGYEPRFTCNLYLQTREEAFKVITSMASIFRGLAYWGAGTVVPVADKPSDAVALFNMANVIDGKFNYQGSAKNTRHTVALVTWNDPEDAYRQKIEYVEDLAGIDRYGVVETDVIAFGCTSRAQAHRTGKWLLYSERLETETVTFRTGLDGVLVAPGQVIKTQDAARAGLRFGGRVVSSTNSLVVIDSPVTIVGGKTYTLSIITPDGTVATSPVTNAPGSTSTLTLSPDLITAPQVNAIWVLAASDLVPETWRVVAMSEVEKTQVEVIALKHNPDKYDAVELDIILEPIPVSAITLMPGGVTNLMATESLFLSGPGVVSNRVTLSWTGTTGRYRVSYKGRFQNLVGLPETPSQTIEIDGLIPDRYTFSVAQVNAFGIVGPPNSLTQEIYGKSAPPADIVGFTVIKSTGFALAQWTLPADQDVQVGGYVIIRHSPLEIGAVWQDGIGLRDFSGGSTQGFCPLITGTYMAKAIDSSGNWSANPVFFTLTEGMVTGFTTVGTSTQHPTFSGTKTSVAVVSSNLQLDGSTLIDDMLDNIDDWPMGDIGGIASFGSYDFSSHMDLTTVITRRFEADITAFSFDTGDTIDVRDEFIDGWDTIDGDVINDCDVKLYASITNDNPVGSPSATWGEWQPFMVADFTCRAARFKLDFFSGQSTHNIAVSHLVIHAKIPA